MNVRQAINLLIILLCQVAFWQWGLSYEHLLTFSGYLAINFMSITMLLAMRPVWLESVLGGLDKIYQLHKWTGILAVIFALGHLLIEMTDDFLKAQFGKERSLREADFSGVLDGLQELAEDFGEPGFYLLLALVIITLIKWLPYHYWRYLHRAMPLVYLALAAHALLLAPLLWWSQPVGWLMGFLLFCGLVASLLSLSGKVGKSHRWQGLVQMVRHLSHNTIEVVCDMGQYWPGHKAGQFALVTFDRSEGAHPFTMASADHHNGRLYFHIKALGDYTSTLPRRLKPGQAVTVEGPYGRFNPNTGNVSAQQIWVAGGCGITPFLAALESRIYATEKSYSAVVLHYCTQLTENDPVVARLQELAARLPEVTLCIYQSQQGQLLTSAQLQIHSATVDIWFCGPSGLATALRHELKQQPISVRFHQEHFEFR